MNSKNALAFLWRQRGISGARYDAIFGSYNLNFYKDMWGGFTFHYIRCADATVHQIIKEAGFVINNVDSNPALVISPNADDAEGFDWICQFPIETLAERMLSKMNIVLVEPGPIAR